MWVPGGTPFLIALLYLGIRWFEIDDRSASSAAGGAAVTSNAARSCSAARSPCSSPGCGAAHARIERRRSRSPPSGGPTLTGKDVSITSFRGHPVVLIFWASWCGPCHDEQPALNTAYATWSSRGVEFLGIDLRDTTTPALAFQSQFKVPYPSIADTNATLAVDYRIPSAPALVFLNSTGQGRRCRPRRARDHERRRLQRGDHDAPEHVDDGQRVGRGDANQRRDRHEPAGRHRRAPAPLTASRATLTTQLRATARDYVSLAKPRIIVLLLITELATMVIAARGIPSLALLFWAALGGALASGGSGAINCWYDRDIDRVMARTCSRPLPSGRILPWQALTFGVSLIAASVVVFSARGEHAGGRAGARRRRCSTSSSTRCC